MKYRKDWGLELVEISINNICNLNCKHCSHMISSNGHRELSLDDWIKIAVQIVDLGVKRIHICGKEPLLSPWLNEFLSTLDTLKTNRNFRYGLVTNGTFIKDCLSWLSTHLIDYIDISIDGLKTGHDFLRGTGNYLKIKKQMDSALSVLGSEKVNVTTVVCPYNIREIPQMIEVFHKIGVKYFFIQPLQLLGKARRSSNLRVSANDYLRFMEELSTRNVYLDALIELFVDYSYKEYFFKSSELFRRTCRCAASGESLAFKIPMGELQLTTNWSCYAYQKSAMITPFGEFLGCSTQATEPKSIGPSAGFVTQSRLLNLVDRGKIEQCLKEFTTTENHNHPNVPSNKFGIIKCPIAEVIENS